MKTVVNNIFDSGITQNKRNPSSSSAALAIRVDTARTQTIRPYKDFELDAVTESGLDNFGIEKFLHTGDEFFGFGRVSTSDNKPQLYKKTSNDPTAVWTTETNGTSASSGARDTDLFVYYKNQDTIYGGNAAGIWSYTVAGDTFTHNENTSVNPSGQGLVHSKDDILYVPCGNVIASKNGAASWNNDAFSGLPSDFNAVSIAESGNYLLIGGNRNNRGVVYVWDRDSTLVGAVNSIDFGDNTLKWVNTSSGVPVVCCTRVDATTGFNEVVFFEVYTNTPIEIMAFNAGSSGSATVYDETQKYGEAIQFMMELTLEGELLVGIWSIQRQLNGSYKLDFITPPRNDTAVTTGKLKGFFRYPGYHFIAYLNENDANKYTVWRTSDQADYVGTTRLHTTINPGMPIEDLFKKKQLVSVTCHYEDLATAGQVVVKYRVDNGSWTTIVTDSTDNSRFVEMISTGSTEFTAGRAYEFRFESTGGAEIVGYTYKYEELETNL